MTLPAPPSAIRLGPLRTGRHHHRNGVSSHANKSSKDMVMVFVDPLHFHPGHEEEMRFSIPTRGPPYRKWCPPVRRF